MHHLRRGLHLLRVDISVENPIDVFNAGVHLRIDCYGYLLL